MNLSNALALCSAAAISLLTGCGAGSRSADEQPSEPLAAYSDAKLAATSIWKVKASVLNCRKTPGVASAVIFELKTGSVVDVVDASKVKKDGYTWIHVNPRGDIDHNTCFVSADDRFLVGANGIDVDNYDPGLLYGANVLKVKTPLNCRVAPRKTAAIIFEAMPALTILDVNRDGDLVVAWADDAWWLNVNPRGDTDHNDCWVAAKKSNVTILE